MLLPHFKSRSHKAAFTLVELLIVIAITAVLITMLVPSLSNARAQARTVVCSTQMAQIAKAMAMYTSDNKSVLPMPNSRHGMDARLSGWMGSPNIANLTVGAAGDGCPENPGVNPRVFPTGVGAAYYMGYIPAIPTMASTSAAYMQRAKVTLLDCPDAPRYRDHSVSQVQWEENQYKALSRITTAFGEQKLYSGTNPYGANWDCVQTGITSYIYRGWLRHDAVAYQAKKQAKRTDDWNPGNVMFVEREYYDYNSTAFPEGRKMYMHGDGFNIAFQDGHVKFGGKDIGGYRPAVYFSITYSGNAPGVAEGSSNLYPYNTANNPLTTATLELFDYYEGR